MNIIDRIGNKQIEKVLGQRQLPEFAPGDTVRVDVKVIEGTRERIQAFEGVCIARKSDGVNSSFTVRKISYGEGVERVFPTHAPQVAGVTVMRRGRVRRAKLYYLRGRTGKAARIAEKVTHRTKTAHCSWAANRPVSIAFIQRFLRNGPCNREQSNLRVIRRCDLFSRIIRVAY